jgi:hypothetical protein
MRNCSVLPRRAPWVGVGSPTRPGSWARLEGGKVQQACQRCLGKSVPESGSALGFWHRAHGVGGHVPQKLYGRVAQRTGRKGHPVAGGCRRCTLAVFFLSLTAAPPVKRIESAALFFSSTNFISGRNNGFGWVPLRKSLTHTAGVPCAPIRPVFDCARQPLPAHSQWAPLPARSGPGAPPRCVAARNARAVAVRCALDALSLLYGPSPAVQGPLGHAPQAAGCQPEGCLLGRGRPPPRPGLRSGARARALTLPHLFTLSLSRPLLAHTHAPLLAEHEAQGRWVGRWQGRPQPAGAAQAPPRNSSGRGRGRPLCRGRGRGRGHGRWRGRGGGGQILHARSRGSCGSSSSSSSSSERQHGP